MKSQIINSVIVALCGLITAQMAYAQASVYVSDLAVSSTGSLSVGSDSWEATSFETGKNPAGYALDSIQLDMAPGSGAPSGFAVMLYTDVALARPLPGSSLGTLSGSSDPVAGGLY